MCPQPDVDEVLEEQRRRMAEVAGERSRVASELLQQQRQEERARVELAARRQQCVRTVEELRAALVRRLPCRKDKQPLAEVSLNIQPAAKTGKNLAQPAADLGKGYVPCCCSTARLCECLAKQVPAGERAAQASPRETPSSRHGKASSTSLFALDSRVSLVPPGDRDPRRRGALSPPLMAHVGETRGEPSQQTCPRTISPICSSAGAIPQNQNDEVCRPSQTREQRLPSSGPSGSTVATSRVGAGQRTAASRADHKVYFYDYSSRFEKEAEARYTVRRHDSAEVGRGSAMEAAQLEHRQQQAAQQGREQLLSRQSERSQLALARERLHADYQRLLRQLPAIARAGAKRLPAAVHLTDERRRQKEALRQSNMASVFERLHLGLLEADNAAAPSPRRTSVTISPQPPDEETPPKLNVAGMCAARSTGGGLEEGNLAAALENLHTRLEQQRALLRGEGGAEERAAWVSEDVQHVSTAQHIGRKVCKKGRLHLYEPVTGQADTQNASYEGNYYRNKQEGGLKSKNQDTAQNNNTKYKHQEDKQEDILRNKQRDGEQERTLKDGHQVDKREGRMEDGHQGDKRGGRVYNEHQEDRHEERSVVRHLEGKHKGRAKDRHQEDKQDGRPKDRHQENKQDGRSKDRYQENKQDGRSKDRHQEDKREGRSKDRHQEDKQDDRPKDRYQEDQDGRSKDRYQEDKREGRSKDRHQEDKREGRSKDRHHDNKPKSISKDWPQEEKLKDRYQEPEQERRVKLRHHNNEQEGTFRGRNEQGKLVGIPRQRNKEGQHDDRSKGGNQEQRKTSKEKNHKMKCDDSSNKRGHKCLQKYRSNESDEDEYRHRSQEQKQESGGGRSRDSSHEGSELTVVSEYSLDVSRSKCAEVNQSSMNSSEQSSSNSMRVYEDVKLQLNVKEVIRSPCRESSQPLHLKHISRSVDVKRCSKKRLQMVEEGTQTSASPRDGEEPSAAGDSRADKTVLESSGSTTYLSPPQQLAGEQAEVIDQLMYAVQHQKDEVQGPHQEPNPTLLLYIARLLSMSRASVEDLSVVSSPTPQGTPCKCLDGDTNCSEHENEKTVPSPRSPRTKGIPPRPPMPTTVPPVTRAESCTSQAVCQSAPVLPVPTTSSQGVVYTEVSALPTCKQPQTKVTSAVGEPKMCSLPTDWRADSHVSLPETCIASSILLPGHKSFEETNSDVNDNSTSQNLCDHSSLRDGSLGMGSANHWSSNGSVLENSIQNYPEFWDKYTTISRQYSERISDISAQIQSVREARMQLESSGSDSHQTVMLSPSLVSPLVPPSDTAATVASSVATVPGCITWREALGGETSSQQRGRQPRQKPPSALERSRLMTGTHTCGPSHELSTIVEVDTPQSSHAFPSTTADRPRSADSDDTLPDVAAEMVRRGLVSASFWQGEGQPSGPGVQDLESALAGLGMSWAGSTLRKVRQAEQLSSTSSETASASRRYSPPEDVRARSTPVPPAPSICFPSESDVSTIHPSPESLDIQAPELSLQRTSLQNHYRAHWEKPPRK